MGLTEADEAAQDALYEGEDSPMKEAEKNLSMEDVDGHPWSVLYKNLCDSDGGYDNDEDDGPNDESGMVSIDKGSEEYLISSDGGIEADDWAMGGDYKTPDPAKDTVGGEGISIKKAAKTGRDNDSHKYFTEHHFAANTIGVRSDPISCHIKG